MDTLVRDIRHAVRALLKTRSATAIAIIALMLGIGANTAIFSVINGVLLKPLPYPDSQRVVQIWEQSPSDARMSISYPNLIDWREQNKTLENIAAVRFSGFNMTGSGDPERLTGRMVSWNFFRTLGISPSIGRDFLREEDSPAGTPVVILSNAFWQRRFGADQNLIGRPLTLNGKDYTVIGILPSSFMYSSPVDLYVPIESVANPLMQQRDFRGGMTAIGRLKPGTTVAQAKLDLAAIASGLAEKYPENKGFGIDIESMYESIVGSIRPTLLVLLGAVAFVLLIACSNVANLQLARATSRQREIGIRTALGASRGRIIRQLLTESVLLSLVGGGLGLLLAMWGTEDLISLMPGTVPRWEGIQLDARVLVFTLVVSVLTGIVFGLIPAFQASGVELNGSLKDAGRGISVGRHWARSVLVVVEMALALVLVTSAGLMLRTVILLHGVDTGMKVQNVLTIDLPLNQNNYPEAAKIRSLHRRLLEGVKGVSGIDAAAITADLPLSGDDSEAPFWVGSGEMPQLAQMPWALLYPVSADYANAMQIPVKAGRFFTDQDNEKTQPVVVIDDLLANGVFPGENPVGRVLRIPSIAHVPEITCQIIGVVGHVKHFGLDTDSQATYQYQLYMPHSQLPDVFFSALSQNITLVARTRTDPLGMVAAIKEQIHLVDKDQPLSNVRTMEQVVTGSIAERRLVLLLMGIFAGLAMLLAMIGIYGVMAYSVTQRTSEMGVRLALGATSLDVIKLVAGQGMTLASVGIGIGLVLALVVTRWMAHLLFGVSATDPLTYGAISLLLALVALAACYLPARRASKVDPIVALRYE